MGKEPARAALLTALVMIGGPALAQTPTPPPTPEENEIVVTGQRGAINRARAVERDANSQVNVITSDAIGEFADQNVAESVRRVPGVNVAREEGEGRTMSVRGLPPAFTAVTVNGARIGSVDGDQSFVQLDSIGSELLDSITITKSVTPDLDGDTIGGSVELSSLSAFTRNKDSFRIGVDGFFSDRAEKWGPEYSASFTKLLLDGRLGIAGSLSFSERDNYGDDLVNDDGVTPWGSVADAWRTANPTSSLQFNLTPEQRNLLRPDEIDHRLEIGTRKRTGATLNFELRPDDANEAFFRVQYTKLDDDDGRFQNEYEPDDADRPDEFRTVSRGFVGLLGQPPVTRTSGSVEFDKQIALANFVDDIFAMSVGSKHDLGAVAFNWQADYSNATAGSDGQYRGRFRVRNIALDADFSPTSVSVRPIAFGTRDPADPASFLFDELRRSDINREDEIVSLQGEIRRDLEIGGREAFIEVGAKTRSRDLTRDTDVFSFNPQSSAFNSVANIAALRGNLSTLPLFRPTSAIDRVGFFPERGAARARFDQVFQAVRPLITPRLVETFGSDYTVGEQTNAGYVMGQAQLGDTLSVIGGVRVEQTEMSTQGFFLQLDDDDNPVTGQLSLLDLGLRKQDYMLALPSVHLMWRPTDRIDVRASYNRGLQRPDFGDFANRQSWNLTRGQLTAGNPFLEPLVADQFDLSGGWFPNRNTALQAGIFYKKLDKFFFDYSGPLGTSGSRITLPTSGVVFPTGVTPATARLETTLNGEDATLIGVELAYSQSYTFLPGLLSGLFTQANFTWIDSEAVIGTARRNEKFTLPGQAELLGNLSVGWENDMFLVRIAGNYVGESLEAIGGAGFEDEFQREFVGLDVTAQLTLGERWQLTFEGANLNEGRDEVVFRGTPQSGAIFRQIEDFGRTYTVGLKARF
jgi:TonB-dependent receptor